MQRWTVKQVADELGVSVGTVHRWTSAGILHAVRTIGGHRRYDPEQLKTSDRLRRLMAGEGTREQGRRILVVDDDEAIRSGLAAELEDHYTVRLAPDGYQAGRMLSVFRPDAVILDLMMDGIDGFVVCRDIKSSPELQDTRVIVLTGFASEEHVEKARRCGADRVLSKPVTGARLREVIEATWEENTNRGAA